MSGLFPSSPAHNVPNWHKVAPVTRVQPVRLDTSAAREDHSNGPKARQAGSAPRPVHSAHTAAAAYAAHVLFEAGEAGEDPASAARGLRAYGQPAKAPQRLFAVA